jgi:hypothetical protein
MALQGWRSPGLERMANTSSGTVSSGTRDDTTLACRDPHGGFEQNQATSILGTPRLNNLCATSRHGWRCFIVRHDGILHEAR